MNLCGCETVCRAAAKLLANRVEGLHANEAAGLMWQAEFAHIRWSFQRTVAGIMGDWTRDYETADDALAALQRKIDLEQTETKSK